MTQLGRYEILQQLATGGGGRGAARPRDGPRGVHAPRRRSSGSCRELATDERFVEDVPRRGALAASLHHQNIVQVYDIDERARRVLLHDGVRPRRGRAQAPARTSARSDALVPLEHVVDDRARPPPPGLHHAHEQRGPDGKPLGIVHRDVSPGNIMVGYDGSVKLVDFGIAKAAQRSTKTRTRHAQGQGRRTCRPSSATGKPIDRRSDVFALGIVLYELVTARRLFKGDNDFLTMTAIVGGEVAPPSTHRPEISARARRDHPARAREGARGALPDRRWICAPHSRASRSTRLAHHEQGARRLRGAAVRRPRRAVAATPRSRPRRPRQRRARRRATASSSHPPRPS